MSEHVEEQIDINKVPHAEIIANRIFDVVSVDEVSKGMVTKILDDWNNEWIDIIAEIRTGKHDGENDNGKRLKRRINKLGAPVDTMNGFDNTGGF
jgi:hypothetical protein